HIDRGLFGELAARGLPRPLTPPAEPVDVDVTPFLGRYERASVRIDVLEKDGEPTVRTELTGPLAALVPETVHEYPMTPVEAALFVVREPDAQTWTPLTFYALPSGEKYLHFGARATPKID